MWRQAERDARDRFTWANENPGVCTFVHTCIECTN